MADCSSSVKILCVSLIILSPSEHTYLLVLLSGVRFSGRSPGALSVISGLEHKWSLMCVISGLGHTICSPYV